MLNPHELALAIAHTLEDKKASNIIIIDVSHLTIVTDYMVIVSGRATTQVKALCDDVEEKTEAGGVFCRRKEGYSEGRWIAMDYSDVIVHIFHEQERQYYNLERLWMDGENTTYIGERLASPPPDFVE